MKTPSVRFLLAAVLLFGAVSVTHAQDLLELRSRMEQRIGQIDTLKTQGIVGENNKGFLEVRSGSDQGVSATENADRAAVYAALAKKTGSTPEMVGRARAKQIAAGSAKGVWVQAEGGTWAQK